MIRLYIYLLIYVFIKPKNDTITVSGGSVAGGSGSLEGKIVIVTSGTKFQFHLSYISYSWPLLLCNHSEDCYCNTRSNTISIYNFKSCYLFHCMIILMMIFTVTSVTKFQYIFYSSTIYINNFFSSPPVSNTLIINSPVSNIMVLDWVCQLVSPVPRVEEPAWSSRTVPRIFPRVVPCQDNW